MQGLAPHVAFVLHAEPHVITPSPDGWPGRDAQLGHVQSPPPGFNSRRPRWEAEAVVPGGCGAAGRLCLPGIPWTAFCMCHGPCSLRWVSHLVAILLVLCKAPFYLLTLSLLLVLTVAMLGTPYTDSSCL